MSKILVFGGKEYEIPDALVPDIEGWLAFVDKHGVSDEVDYQMRLTFESTVAKLAIEVDAAEVRDRAREKTGITDNFGYKEGD